jgi:hypothetical protein
VLDAQKIIQKNREGRDLARLEAEALKRMNDNASHVMSFGKKAVTVLAGRGVGTATAGRILAKLPEGDELLHEILKAERLYARNKRFWRG